MVDLQELEMSGLGEAEGLNFESLYGEEGELEDFLDYENFAFEGEEEYGSQMNELEADPFLGSIINQASKVMRNAGLGGLSPTFFQQLATQAAKVAGGAVAGKKGAAIASQLAGQALREGESEWESEEESSFGSGAIDRETLDEMNYNAYQAGEAESEAEANQFIGDLISPLVSGLMSESPQSYEDLFEGEYGSTYERDEFLPALLPFAMPLISKGVGAIGKMLSKNKATRPLARCLPKVMKEAVEEAESYGRPLNPSAVAGILGRQSARAFGNQAAVARALRQNRAAASRAQMRPPGMRWQGGGMPGRVGPNASFGPRPSRGRRRRGPVVGFMLKPIYASPRRR